MSKRQKWSATEDDVLARVILGLDRAALVSDDWETVSAQMTLRGLHKTAKQCRERLTEQLAPPSQPRPFTREMEQRTEPAAV